MEQKISAHAINDILFSVALPGDNYKNAFSNLFYRLKVIYDLSLTGRKLAPWRSGGYNAGYCAFIGI
jgi:hypothetical protein